MKIKKTYSCSMCEGKQCDLIVYEEDERFFDETVLACPFTPNEPQHGFSEIRKEVIE